MSEWKAKRLGDLISIKHGYAFKGEYFSDVGPGPLLITPGNFSIGGGFKEGKPKYYLGPIPDEFRLKPGDLVVTMTDLSKEGDTLGYPAIIPPNPDYLHNQRIGLISIKSLREIDEVFLFYALRTLEYRDFVLAGATGSTVRHTSPSRISDYEILVPDYRVQRSIAEALRALDDLISLNSRMAKACRELIKLNYRMAVASDVKSVQISEVAELYDGPHATPKKTELGPWFLSISSLKSGQLLLDESAHLSEDDFKQWTRRVTPQFGDVLFSYETRLGEAALMPPGIRACLGRRMALLRPRNVGSRTLLQAFLSSSFQEAIKKYSVHGATVDRIPLAEFPSWRIELPAHEPWKLEAALGPLDDLAQQRERENESLTQLRDTLLPKLMSGEIRVRDAEKVVEEVT